LPSAQTYIRDAYPDSLVAVCSINMDATLDWILTYRQQYNLHIPLLHHAGAAFQRYRIGGQFGAWPPAHIIIDKRGVIRWRSIGTFSIAMQDAARMVGELIRE